MADLAKMSKKQLESYARKEHGVELDRRHSKKQLLAKVQELSEDKEEVEVLKPPAPKPEVPKGSTINMKRLEELKELRRDASIIWNEIQDKDLTDEDIREVIRSHNFGTLLGKVSQ